jgi:zinc-binding alcohol dehydrogenase/oxidoreductase
MKAVILKEAKRFEGLVIDDVPTPKPNSGEVLVQIKAAALNHRDIWIIQGLYPNIKVPAILGSDGAGIVSEVGKGVDKKWVGAEVIINPSLNWGDNPDVQQRDYRILGVPVDGTHAEYVVVPESNILRKPEYLSFEETAAIALAGVTGYRALFRQGRLQKGETILITGIGGGVASLVQQMALAVGATLLVTSGSDEKLNRAKQLGASGGANYNQEDWEKKIAANAGEKGVDLIVDGAGGPGLDKLIELVKPAGRIVIYGATAGKPPDLNIRRVFWKQITIQGTTMGNEEDFRNMIEFFGRHQLKPIIHKTYNLENYKEAYLEMMNKKQFGKIVLNVRRQM